MHYSAPGSMRQTEGLLLMAHANSVDLSRKKILARASRNSRSFEISDQVSYLAVPMSATRRRALSALDQARRMLG